MDEATLQAILDSLPPKAPRSRLEPYTALITELRRRGWSYADVARVLEEKCQVKVAPITIFDFLRVRAKSRGKANTPAGKTKADKLSEREVSAPKNQDRTVEERIAALKQRSATVNSQKPVFTYREDEPLTLRPSPNEDEEV
jgi:IS30 family transposase